MDQMIITTLVSAFTALGGFLYGLKREQTNLVSTSLDNIQKQILIYEQIIENLRAEISTLIKEVDKQKEIIKELENKIEEFMKPKTNL